MTDRHPPNTLDDLEVALADLAAEIAFPPTPDLAAAVATRLREPRVTVTSPRPMGRRLRRSLLLAAVLTMLVVGAALAVRLGLDLLSVETGPIPSPSASPAPTAATGDPGSVGARLGLGTPLALDEVRAAAPFTVLVPAALGAPDAVYLGGANLRGQVSFVYGARDGLPASTPLDGAGLLVTQNHGEPDDGLARKLVDAGLAAIEPVTVDGTRGLWITGEPHVFWYLAPDGSTIEDSRRLVGDTLVWERDGVLYRIEGAASLTRALEIATSME